MYTNTLLKGVYKHVPSLSCQTNFFAGAHHWICTSYDPVVGDCVRIMDSRSNVCEVMNENLQLQLQLSKIYAPVALHPCNILKVEVLSVQQQLGLHDCGLFAIAYATELAAGGDPERVQFHQERMREHLVHCLTRQHFLPFPKSVKHNSLHRPNRPVQEIMLYCTCRMPEAYDEKMICCDSCNSWFHFSCIDLHYSKNPAIWKCFKCM